MLPCTKVKRMLFLLLLKITTQEMMGWMICDEQSFEGLNDEIRVHRIIHKVSPVLTPPPPTEEGI
jgi:hypothetical protein